MVKMLRSLAVLAASAPLLGALDPSSVALPDASVPICHTETQADDDALKAAVSILSGYGTGGFKITTANPEAQAYFNNGMQLAHAFAHKAATSAFMKAEQLDPTCAMCVWGESWSRGPTINFGIGEKSQVEAAALADKAAVLAKGNPSSERALIAALQHRYHKGGGAGSGDDAFAKAMDDLAKAEPDDDEIAIIAADAWMIPASTRVYVEHRSRAAQHPSLLRARELLLGVLNRSPDNSAAIHFYIHATENDGVGTLALPYAEKLEALAPASSHLVHMPSHTFLWAGRFVMAEAANIDAVKIDQANALRLKTKEGVFGLPYHAHNVMFGLGAALLDNDANGALFLAADDVARLPAIKPRDVYEQRALSSAYFAYGRFADLKVVQTLPDPGAKLPFAQAMRQYAIGEAAARAGDGQLTMAAAEAIAHMSALPAGELRNMADVARLVLQGRAAMLQHRYEDAETFYRKAAEIEEARLRDYRDPPAWWYPPRRSLAAALMAQGRPIDAAREVKAVLIRWPYDPISLRLAADAGVDVDRQAALAHAASNWTGDIRALPNTLM